VLVTSAAPFDLAPLREAAARVAARPDARTARLPLPTGLDQRDLLLRKD
jgi:hypothetical protein